MATDTDNPILEPAAVFYGTPETLEPKEPTEVDDVTNGDDLTAEVEEPEVIDQEEEVNADDSEESVSEDEEIDTEGGEQELTYLDLDGKEVDLNDVRKWRDGHLMQADYTQKTTLLAEDRKAITAEREELTTAMSEVANLKAEMQALIEEDEAIDWKELREYEPEKYIELKEKADKRKSAAAKAKTDVQPAQTPLTQEELVQEQQLLHKANPNWLDDKGKPTKEMQLDKQRLESYWKTAGFTAVEVNGMARARYIDTCLKAAKFDELQEKSKTLSKKAKKATLVTKPKNQPRKLKTKGRSAEEIFYNS